MNMSSIPLTYLRTNKYLDQANSSFFRPRGLFCLVMTYDPEASDSSAEVVDLNGKLASKMLPTSGSSNSSTSGRMSQAFRASSGNDLGSLSSMQTAPLVYPQRQTAIKQGDEAKRTTKEKMNRMGAFVSDFNDRRAQAKFVSLNPRRQRILAISTIHVLTMDYLGQQEYILGLSPRSQASVCVCIRRPQSSSQ